jgi:hypothetical protein
MIEGTVVEGSSRIARTKEGKRRGKRSSFSLSSLLLAMVLCGVGAAIAARNPPLNQQVWQSVIVSNGRMRWRRDALRALGGELVRLGQRTVAFAAALAATVIKYLAG